MSMKLLAEELLSTGSRPGLFPVGRIPAHSTQECSTGETEIIKLDTSAWPASGSSRTARILLSCTRKLVTFTASRNTSTVDEQQQQQLFESKHFV